MNDINANHPVVLPGDAWDLSPADPELRILGVLTLSAGTTDAWIYVDRQFLHDVRAIIENRAADTPRTEGDGYEVSKVNDVLYVAVTDQHTNVTVECAPEYEEDFLATVQRLLDRRRDVDARYYLTRAAILLVTVAVIAAIWIAAPHVIA